MGLGWLLPLLVLVLFAALVFRGLSWSFGRHFTDERDREMREDLRRLREETEKLREEIRRLKEGGRSEGQ